MRLLVNYNTEVEGRMRLQIVEWMKSWVVKFGEVVRTLEAVIIERFEPIIKSRIRVRAESAIAVPWMKSMTKERLVSVVMEAIMSVKMRTAIMAIMAR